MILGADANFTEALMVNTVNSDLANDYGNLLSRLLKMVENYFDGKIPEPAKRKERDKKVMNSGTSLPAKVKESVNKMRLNDSLGAILSYIRMINKYIDDTAPWNLHKEARIEELKMVIYTACEAFRIISILLSPIILDKAENALSVFSEKVLKYTVSTNTEGNIFSWGRLKPGTKIKGVKNLFPRIILEEEKNKEEKVREKSITEMIDIEYFKKMNIKVGKILKASQIKGSKKLLFTIMSWSRQASVCPGKTLKMMTLLFPIAFISGKRQISVYGVSPQLFRLSLNHLRKGWYGPSMVLKRLDTFRIFSRICIGYGVLLKIRKLIPISPLK